MTDATDDDIWDHERRFWTGHAAFHDKTVPADTIMVFGPPLGVTKGDEARKALDEAPDWSGVEMSEKSIARPAKNVAVTGYLAEGDAGNGAIHRVYCTSVWIARDDGWVQAQHQQTPAPDH
ncbi:hypothetical protein [Tropicimonas sp. IMCC34011]|uniref:hypothetical protein n=1 Tax=Tropicimonas sp. IMCC34011 TaxID=2248759 RepID=UPI000E220CF9|nr:hypothetical protein [Tropicimonas sp. IMCC34011]